MVSKCFSSARAKLSSLLYVGLAVAGFALCLPQQAHATYTPATLSAPVEVIDVDAAITTVITFVGPIMASIMVMMLGFAAVSLIWRWFRSFAKSGKA